MAFKKPRPTSSKSGTKKFEYRPRTSEEMNKRAHQSSGNREGFFKTEVKVWTPKDGDNRIRILPPTWEDAGHYGLEVFAHYQVGPDNSAFLCRKKHFNEDCPICDARKEALDDGDEEQSRALNWRKRVIMWIIDRKEEGKGPQLWSAPWTLDQDIAKQSMDEDGEVFPLDHPEEGYDVMFTREAGGGKQPPKYTGAKIARKSSPIFDDEEEVEKVLAFISKNPVPDQLVFHEAETIEDAFNGKSSSDAKKSSGKNVSKGKGKKDDEDEDEDDAPPKKKKTAAAKKSSKSSKAELPSWDEVHDLSEDELNELAESQDVDFGDEEFDDLEAVADYLCEQLGIEKPKKGKAAPDKKSSKSKKKDDDDEDEDGDDDDEDEEDEPPKKKPSKAKKNEDEDDEDEDDEPPAKKKASAKSKKDDDDEDEEEAPKKKTTVKSKKKEEDEEEEDDDDEEEEEKPKKAESWKDKVKKFKKG